MNELLVKSSKTQNQTENSDFDAEEMIAEFRAEFRDILKFVETPAFQALVDELYALPSLADQADFVLNSLLNKQFIESKGIFLPENVTAQPTPFGAIR